MNQHVINVKTPYSLGVYKKNNLLREVGKYFTVWLNCHAQL
ncbi:hypothetical protein L293_2228 [Acinetobacter gyllenbergii CIP 110306 = MTCC 11365]|nr:hypothetical protein L293_2228 [Acinetobacter gyllenbergii CIP 110306 = MTCC 11365]